MLQRTIDTKDRMRAVMDRINSIHTDELSVGSEAPVILKDHCSLVIYKFHVSTFSVGELMQVFRCLIKGH